MEYFMITKIQNINFPYVNHQFRFVINLTVRNREDVRARIKDEDYFQDKHIFPQLLF